MRDNKVPTSPIGLSAQVLVNCAQGTFNYGCNGGDPYAAIEYIYKNGVTHSSCEQYVAWNEIEHGTQNCDDKRYICRDCDPVPHIPTTIGQNFFEACRYPDKPTPVTFYYANSYGNATNADEMKK